MKAEYQKHKSRNKGSLIYLAAFIVIALIGSVYKLVLKGSSEGIGIIRKEEEETASVSDTVRGSEESTAGNGITLISVYVCGSVRSPGVYELPSGSIINDAVKLAGGMCEDAASDHVDLVRIMESNMTIYIPSKEEVEGVPNPFLDESVKERDGDDGNGALIDINTADKETLMTLPGIGGSTADAIIEYRKDNRFEKKEDITKVSGIGEGKYNKIKDLICV